MVFINQLEQTRTIFVFLIFVFEHLVPFAPEFGCRASGGITSEGVANCKKQCAIHIQPSYAVFLLVAQMLRNGLFFSAFDIGTFAFDDDHRDSVHKQHYVRTISVVHACARDRKFFRDVIHVIFGMLPVDVAHSVALPVAVDALLESFSESEHVIHRLIPVEVAAFHRHVAQRDDAVFDVLFRKTSFAMATDANGVELAQLLSQHFFEQHI